MFYFLFLDIPIEKKTKTYDILFYLFINIKDM